MLRRFAVTLALGIVTAPLTAAFPQSCPSVGWEPPTSLSVAGVHRLRMPSIVASRTGDAFIVGNAEPTDPTGRTQERFRLVAWHLRQTSTGSRAVTDLGQPAGQHSIPYPAAAVDDLGRLHILWIEDASSAGAMPPRAHDAGGSVLWHAAFQRGTWTPPEVIARFQRATWNPSTRSQWLATPDSGLAIAIPVAKDSIGGVALVHIDQQGRSRMGFVRTPSSLEPAYVALGNLIHGRVLLVHVSANNGRVADVNSVFAMTVSLAGTPLSPSRLVSLSGKSPASNPVVTSSGATIRIVWIQSTDSTSDVPIIRYSTSRDGGGSWSRPVSTGIRGARAIHPCGQAAVIAEVGELRQSHLVVTSIPPLGSQPGSSMFPDLLSYAPTVASDATGCTHLLWTAASRDSTRFDGARQPPRPTLRYSRACGRSGL